MGPQAPRRRTQRQTVTVGAVRSPNRHANTFLTAATAAQACQSNSSVQVGARKYQLRPEQASLIVVAARPQIAILFFHRLSVSHNRRHLMFEWPDSQLINSVRLIRYRAPTGTDAVTMQYRQSRDIALHKFHKRETDIALWLKRLSPRA